jgi:hypothetical protein
VNMAYRRIDDYVSVGASTTAVSNWKSITFNK